MRKFFLFRREADDIGSGATTSNTGVGISTISIPADNLAYMTTKPKGLVITFNQSSAFESSFLNPGESIPKTTVEIGCAEGEEAALMESILNFISSESKKNVMRFDTVNKNSTFAQFVQEKESLSPIVPTLAVDTVSGEISQGTESQQFQNSIAGINFQGNFPVVDYNHEVISGLSNGATITSWKNSGTGGGTYNILPGGSTTPSMVKAANQNNFSKDAVLFGIDEYFDVPSLKVVNDYTIYAVIGTFNTASGLGPLYGDADGETVGFSGRFFEDGAVDKVNPSNNTFNIRHDGKLGAIAQSFTLSSLIGDGVNRPAGYNPCSVFIIRRDKDFNMILHDETGEIISVIPASTGGRANDPGQTDGDLLFERLGTSNEVNAFKGELARFGIIENDIGSNAASTLAKDLFNLYTL
tara:strand:- start:1613 stop:2848 length:1236 start_codon:yes stop_codon:yes gene_type:complete